MLNAECSVKRLGSGGSAVVMRCAAAKDDVRKLKVHGLSAMTVF